MAAGLIFAAAIGLAALVTAALSSDYGWPARSLAIVMLCGSAAVGITYEFVSNQKEADAE
jgi:multisubunit Na+/H+ antiporter MnhB subunit